MLGSVRWKPRSIELYLQLDSFSPKCMSMEWDLFKWCSLFSMVIFHANDRCDNIMVLLAETIGRHNHQSYLLSGSRDAHSALVTEHVIVKIPFGWIIWPLIIRNLYQKVMQQLHSVEAYMTSLSPQRPEYFDYGRNSKNGIRMVYFWSKQQHANFYSTVRPFISCFPLRCFHKTKWNAGFEATFVPD